MGTKKFIMPLGDRLLVRQVKAAEITSSGIIIPEEAQQKSDWGHVIEIGPDVVAIDKHGKVLFGKFAGTEIKWEGEMLLILKEEDILARECLGSFSEDQ